MIDKSRIRKYLSPVKKLIMVICCAVFFSQCIMTPDMFAWRSRTGEELFASNDSAVMGIANAYLTKRLCRGRTFDAEAISNYASGTTWTETLRPVQCGGRSVALRNLGRELEASDGKTTRTFSCPEDRLLLGPMWCEENGRVGLFVADYSLASLPEQLVADDMIGYRIYPASLDPSQMTFQLYRKVAQEQD